MQDAIYASDLLADCVMVGGQAPPPTDVVGMLNNWDVLLYCVEEEMLHQLAEYYALKEEGEDIFPSSLVFSQ